MSQISRNLKRRVLTNNGAPKRKSADTAGPPGGFTLGSTYLGGPLFTDAFSSKRAPSPWQLIEKYKSLIYALVDKNAHARCRVPLRLYADSSRGAKPRSLCDPVPVTPSIRRHLESLEYTRVSPSSVDQVYEIRNHPILDALDKPDPYGYFTRAKFLNLISRYCDVVGSHWVMPEGNGWREEGATVKGPPYYLWVLYSQYVLPVRMAGSPLINYFQYFAEHIPFEHLVWFRANHSLRDPYGSGYSPTYAGDQYATLEDEFVAIQNQLLGLGPRPNMIATVKDPLQPPGEIERKRFENELRERHSRGYAGGVLVANGAWDFTPVSYSPADLGQLKVSEYDLNRLCNIFGVPPSYFSTDTNLANLQAADTQHARDAVEPWCVSVAGTLTNLVREFDNRLCFAFDPCVPEDEERKARIVDMQLKSGLITINQANEESQWPPAKWGDAPWIAGTLKQPDMITEAHETGIKAIEEGAKEDGDSKRGSDRGGRNGSSVRDRDSSRDTSNDKGGNRSLARGEAQSSAIERKFDALLNQIERELERYNPYRDPSTGKFTSGPGGKGGGIVGPPKKGGGHKRKPRKPRKKGSGPKAAAPPLGHFRPDPAKVSPSKGALYHGSEGKSKAPRTPRVIPGAFKPDRSPSFEPGRQKTVSERKREKKAIKEDSEKASKAVASERDRNGHDGEGIAYQHIVAHGHHQNDDIERFRQVTATFPAHVKEVLAKSGCKIVYADRLENYDPETASKTPRGWKNGLTWSHTEGMYDGNKHEIVISRERKNHERGDIYEESTRIPGVLRHEAGHAYDSASGKLSETESFRSLHERDKADLERHGNLYGKQVEYYTQSGSIGASETFAEVFADHIGGGCRQDTVVSDYFPRCAAYIKDRLKVGRTLDVIGIPRTYESDSMKVYVVILADSVELYVRAEENGLVGDMVVELHEGDVFLGYDYEWWRSGGSGERVIE